MSELWRGQSKMLGEKLTDYILSGELRETFFRRGISAGLRRDNPRNNFFPLTRDSNALEYRLPRVFLI